MTQPGAVFLDRDGVLLEHLPYITRVDQLALIPTAVDAVTALNRAGIAAVLITNQSVVARGGFTERQLEEIHRELGRALYPARLDGVYYCPHLPPDAGDPPQPPYRVVCDCRKPAPGLLRRASRDLGIALHGSLMIGDSTSDAEAGRLAGVATAGVRTGVGGSDARYDAADRVFGDVAEAVRWWLDEGRALEPGDSR